MDKTSTQQAISTGVVAGRLLLFLAAAVAFVAAVVMSQARDDVANGSSQRYVCPMHPQVTSSAPGDCPICNMALERMIEAKQTQPLASRRKMLKLNRVKRMVLTQAVRAPASLGIGGVVTAVVYKELLQGAAPGDTAVFFRNTEPARAISVRLTSDPPTPWDASTVRARFASEATPIEERDTGWLQLKSQPRAHLVVPESAVLYSAKGAYVLAMVPGGQSLTRRTVQVGRIVDSGYAADVDTDHLGVIAILSGLNEGQRIVTTDAFFMGAERRLRAAHGRSEEVTE